MELPCYRENHNLVVGGKGARVSIDSMHNATSMLNRFAIKAVACIFESGEQGKHWIVCN